MPKTIIILLAFHSVLCSAQSDMEIACANWCKLEVRTLNTLEDLTEVHHLLEGGLKNIEFSFQMLQYMENLHELSGDTAVLNKTYPPDWEVKWDTLIDAHEREIASNKKLLNLARSHYDEARNECNRCKGKAKENEQPTPNE